MRKWLKQTMTMVLCLGGCSHPPPPKLPPPELKRWAAYYDSKRPAEVFADLDLVVFDLKHHPKLKPLKHKVITLAYVSIGEVHGDDPDRKLLAEKGNILMKNEEWGSYVVDITQSQWQEMVIRQVDKAMTEGFDGVMLDTVDSPLYWTQQHLPDCLAETRASAVKLIHDIRAKYPNKKIMLNRGFEILPEAGPDLDYVLAESILAYKDKFTGQPTLESPKAYADAVEQLHTVLSRNRQLQILTLDYWNMTDENGVAEIYRMQRESNFVPYVTTRDLKHFHPEPSHAKSL